MKRHLLSLAFTFCCMPLTALAWGPDGHHSVGAIADTLLVGSKAGQKVTQVLQQSSLEQLAVWADCVKGINPEKDFAYTSSGKYPECAPFESKEGIDAMSAYVRRNHSNCNPAEGEESCHKQYHYTNVAIQHAHYKSGYVGTNEHDIVHAIGAAVAFLQGKPAVAPFQFQDEREALSVLTHLVGDLHQPLHVGSVFLSNQGKIINPDAAHTHYNKGSSTVGGNALVSPCGNLHSMWDDLPQAYKHGRMNTVLKLKASKLAKTPGSSEQWPKLWADQTIGDAKTVFASMQFSKSTATQRGNNWSIALPLEYEKTMLKIKEEALIKAGAHLAQLLQSIWPE